MPTSSKKKRKGRTPAESLRAMYEIALKERGPEHPSVRGLKRQLDELPLVGKDKAATDRYFGQVTTD